MTDDHDGMFAEHETASDERPRNARAPDAAAEADAHFAAGVRHKRDGRYVQSVRCFSFAAREGHAIAQFAQYQLGLLYRDGLGVQRDFAQAAGWFGSAARSGHPRAQYRLGLAYLNGHGVDGDAGLAAQWLRRAAINAVREAQFALGMLYLEGRGVGADAATAARWIGEAAASDLAGAQYTIGWLYETGDGVGRDLAKAMHWYGKAGMQGFRRAQAASARLFQAGWGVAWSGQTPPESWLQRVDDRDDPVKRFAESIRRDAHPPSAGPRAI